MASPSTRMAPTPTTLDDATESFADWVRLHARHVATGAIVLAAAVGGYVIYRSSSATKAVRAEQAYFEAQAPLASRDLAAAERQLRDVANRYDGTAGGAQAQMLLAQVLFDQGKYEDGMAALRQADDAPSALQPSVQLLKAAGHEGLGQFAEAARLYESAADRARGQTREPELRAQAARAHQRAGNLDAARRIWADLATREGTTTADEARVRLGELVASGEAGTAAETKQR